MVCRFEVQGLTTFFARSDWNCTGRGVNWQLRSRSLRLGGSQGLHVRAGSIVRELAALVCLVGATSEVARGEDLLHSYGGTDVVMMMKSTVQKREDREQMKERVDEGESERKEGDRVVHSSQRT